MAGNGETNLYDPVDPEVRVFVEQVNAEFVRQGPFDGLPFPEARRVAEQVRLPWRQGGPRMADTREILVPTGGEVVRIRLYDPGRSQGSTPLRAALVYMHGGGWTLFSLDTHDRLMREYAARSGLIVIGVDYALSPEAKFPTALEQVTGVVRWLREHGAILGVDAERIALGGDSAGGNLAITASLKLRDDQDAATIAGILVNYGAFAPECSDDATRRYGGDGYMLGTQELLQFWANYLNSADDAKNPLACPMRASLAGLPPVHMAIAECDVLCEQNLIMAERLRAAGVAVEATVYRGATHSFLEAVAIAQVAVRALEDASRWLVRTTALPR